MHYIWMITYIVYLAPPPTLHISIPQRKFHVSSQLPVCLVFLWVCYFEQICLFFYCWMVMFPSL